MTAAVAGQFVSFGLGTPCWEVFVEFDVVRWLKLVESPGSKSRNMFVNMVFHIDLCFF